MPEASIRDGVPRPPEVRGGRDVPLAGLTTLGLGGTADRVLVARGEDEVVAAVRDADAAGEPLLVLGGGSNVVVADAGFRGTALVLRGRGRRDRRAADGRVLREVDAGEPWEDVVASAVADGLAGVECLTGIPGAAGATPIQNVGAYGQEVAATIAAVRVLDRRDGTVRELAPEACGFGYRRSAFKGRDTHVVLSVTFALEPCASALPVRYAELARALDVAVGDRPPLHEVREAVLRLRRGKGMVLDPADPDTTSAGSFFTNPILEAPAFAALERRVATVLGDAARPPRFPEAAGAVKTSAAWLIERAGFPPGHALGGAALSSKHVLALTNRGGGTDDLLALAREVAAGVQERFGVALHPEPVLVGIRW